MLFHNYSLHKTSGGSYNFTAQEPPMALLTIAFSVIVMRKRTTRLIAKTPDGIRGEKTITVRTPTTTTVIILASKYNQPAHHQ
jgi:hypothetical protein